MGPEWRRFHLSPDMERVASQWINADSIGAPFLELFELLSEIRQNRPNARAVLVVKHWALAFYLCSVFQLEKFDLPVLVEEEI